MTDAPILLTDDPAPHVRRLTLNRPAKRNALSNALRGEIFASLEAADRDPEVRVIILRGAGACFSSGYDLSSLGDLPFHTSGGQGQWARHVVEVLSHVGPRQAHHRPGSWMVPGRRV